MALAVLGVGLSGGVPIPTNGRKTDRENYQIELVDVIREAEENEQDVELNQE